MRSVENEFAEAATAPPASGATASVSNTQISDKAETHIKDPARYRVIQEHGRGGLGRVVRAYDSELQRDIAIKELLHRDNVSETRFLREALITARLEHPGIVPIHEAGTWPDGTPFYAMKLVAGRSFRDLIAERRTVAERILLLHHIIAIADAIAYAHKRNIIHRDLKPANVIIGDFGETVVIDWGLAKELDNTAPRSNHSNQPTSTHSEQDLTATGGVIGTPSYMPPEQARGERVDQRADVFAIGAMLWEICSLHKVPPTSATRRQEMLRHAGIDRDLGAIVEKALDADPANRYPDAGALASDLKAFKSGSRITAHSYSLFSLIALWLKRRRALAVTIATAVASISAVTILHIQNIATERDRADEALEMTRIAQNDLILEHAALLLHSDPTATAALLTKYQGQRNLRTEQLQAEALGRGIAYRTISPHHDTIHLLAGIADGSILSAADDQRIVLTESDNKSTTLAHDLSSMVVARYSSDLNAIAYASQTGGTKLLFINTRQTVHLATSTPFGIAFSPDGRHIAIMDSSSMLSIFSTSSYPNAPQQSRIPDGANLIFANDDRIAIAIPQGLAIYSLTKKSTAIIEASLTSFAASPDRIGIGTRTGTVQIYDIDTLKPIGESTVCRERVRDIAFVASQQAFAFACEEGSAGVADYAPHIAVRVRFPTRGAAIHVRTSHDSKYVIVVSDSNIAYLHDTETWTTHSYEGQSANLNAAIAPTNAYPSMLTGDINGTIRIWNVEPSASRVVAHMGTSILRAAISPSGSNVASISDGTLVLTQLSDRKQIRRDAHTGIILNLRYTPNGKHIITNSFDGTASVWDSESLAPIYTFKEHHSLVSDLDLTNDDSHVVTVGNDGRLLKWPIAGGAFQVLFHTQLSLPYVEVLSHDQTMAVADAAGTVWHINENRTSNVVRHANGDTVSVLRASKDGRLLAIGTSQGNVFIYNTVTWQQLQTLSTKGSIRQLAFAPDNNAIAVATEARLLHILYPTSAALSSWGSTSLDVRDITFSHDGKLMVIVCREGQIWLHSLGTDKWIFTQDHHALTSYGRLSTDGRLFVSSDRGGMLVVRDIVHTWNLTHTKTLN